MSFYKDLGAYDDNKFMWYIHVDNLQQKLHKSTFMTSFKQLRDLQYKKAGVLFYCRATQ